MSVRPFGFSLALSTLLGTSSPNSPFASFSSLYSSYANTSTSSAFQKFCLFLTGVASGVAVIQARRHWMASRPPTISSAASSNAISDLAKSPLGAAGADRERERGPSSLQVAWDDGGVSAGDASSEDLDDEGFSSVDADENYEDQDAVEITEPPDESENLLSLLSSIAEDQAKKEGYVHRSITCNHCGVSPIRGFRFKCANCVDYDVCETCEALEVHFKTHVFVKIRIPIPPLMNARSALIPVIYPGVDFTDELNSYDVEALQRESHFDIVELDAFHEQFLSLSNVEEGGIDRETFQKCLGPLGLEKNLIVERIFLFFDRDGNGTIEFEELVMGLSVLCKGGLDERMKWAFKGYDLNGDGYISRDELHQMFKAYFHLSMELVRDVVKTMEDGMMESFDDEAAKPVSAAFAGPSGPYTGPIGSESSDEEDADGEERGEEGGAETSHQSRRRLRRAKRATEDGYDILANFATGGTGGAATSAMQLLSTRPRRGSNNSDHQHHQPYQQQQHQHQSPPSSSSSSLAFSPPTPTNTSSLTNTTNTAPSIRPVRRLTLRRSLPHLSTSSPLRTSLDPNSPQGQAQPTLFGGILPSPNQPYSAIEEQWPVMEAMSQDAIEEMVDKVFETAELYAPGDQEEEETEEGRTGKGRGLSYDQFVTVVELDSNLLAWFEALGSVF